MRSKTHLSLLAAAMLLLSLPFSAPRALILDLPPHPRLIVYGTAEHPTRLEELSALVDEVGDPQQWSERKKVLVLAFRSLRAGSWVWHQSNLEAQWGQSPVRQDGQYRCLATLALTDLLMKNKGSLYPEYATGRIYAQKASAFLHWWRDHRYYNWGQAAGDPNELAYAELLAGYALFYDWCHDALSLPERAYHARAIYHMLTDEENLYLFQFGDWRYASRYDNNHLGVIFGAAGLAALALDQDDPVFDATARDSIAWYRRKAAARVRDYLDASFPGEGEGAGIEGMLYAMYGLNLALPYSLATQRLGTVEPGYDALPANLRVDGPRNAYQAPTWLFYEQLPFNPSGAPPLNDTARPPYDLHPSFRAWPWLMGFSTSEDPNLAVPFFQTIYPPAAIASAVIEDFDYRNPGPSDDPFDVREPMEPDPKCLPSRLNSVGILLGWPESPSYPTLDPSDLEHSAYFPGRGITYFRTGVQLLNPDGTLDWNPDSCLITFECRQHPTYPVGFERWSGHTQQDVNHFTVFFARQPLFYDAGYAGWRNYPSFFSCAHSLHQVRIDGGPWQDFTEFWAMGSAIGSVIGAGIGPSLAGGINTECWSTDVVRSVRRIVVLPRPGDPAPYFLLHDDFELAAAGKVRAIMQTANEFEGTGANMPLINGNVARWDKGDARAVLAFLSPETMSVSADTLAPNDTINWPIHWEVLAEVPASGTRHQIVSMVEPRYVDDTSSELLEATLTIPTTDPEGLAYQIDSGRLTDVLAFRPYDRTGTWWVYPQGYDPIEAHDATVVALRFDETATAPDRIRGGLLSGGGSLIYGGRRVAALDGGPASTLTFSEAGASIWTEDGQASSSVVGSIYPAALSVNGKPAPVSLLTTPDGAPPTRVSLAMDAQTGSSATRLVSNPLRMGAEILWSGDENGTPITIDIYDVSGRRIRVFENGSERRATAITWDGRTSDGERVPTGMYLLHIRQGESAWNRRVLVVR